MHATPEQGYTRASFFREAHRLLGELATLQKPKP